ncbi:hypothetical protein [Flagellimonas olearia]|uniref:Periplasmic heavy metal sensor n=1 Tax=Flagellimonas olearia TaxID=552546 RepID=A0A444VKM5_9FLAO|nr:hypothetical protein [Allomuricauda olearia]RYC51327.1 hypothetical protein DN53_14075 [Allomuricauda olearia]
MKKISILSLLALCIGLLCASEAFAQYGYGSPYGNRYGRRQSTLPQVQSTPKEEEPPTAEEVVDGQMPSITEALGLNPFEEAVVRTTLVQSVQKRIELQILGLEPLKAKEEIEKIEKIQNEELKAGLPEDKYNAFMELQENRFKSTKKKKKKKKKKD